MLAALHAGLLDGGLVVWGEGPVRDTEPGSGTTAPRASARGRSRRAAPGTFGLPGEDLAEALAEAVPTLGLEAFEPAEAVAWLPTTAAAGGLPLPSQPALGDPAAAGDPPVLAAWRIEGIRLAPEAAFALLSRCTGRADIAPGLLVGPDLRFWVAALRLAADLAARQMFLPSVRGEGDGYRAGWEPLLSGRAGLLADRLAQAMPAACRALSASAGAPPDIPARTLLLHFVRGVLDHFARGPEPGAPAKDFDSLDERWLSALRTPDSGLPGAPREVLGLAARAREWAAPLLVRRDAAFRLCFRLEEPVEVEDAGDAEGSWHVRYLLQATDDPSLLFPAEQVWKPARHGGHAHHAHPGTAPLLAALGRAAALCAEVDQSLRGPEPCGFPCDAAGAHAFLTETAWLLEEAGFGVMLPAWWTRGGTRTRLAARAHVRASGAAGAGGFGLDAALEFDWRVALGDQILTHAELEALARQKSPLVRVRGQWVQVDAEQIRAALAVFAGRAPGRGTLRQALRLSAGTEAAAGLPVATVEGEGWVAELLGADGDGPASGGDPATAAARGPSPDPLRALEPPAGLRAILRPYQARGYAWLHHLARHGLGACLADDMGLGKTLQTLAFIARDRAEGAHAPTLLVCPTSVLGNWVKEAERFTPDLAVLPHHGPDRARGEAFTAAAGRQALVATTYALLPRDLELLRTVAWRGIVLDEAQNVKNAEAKQAKAARSLAAEYRVALTGTPVENSVGDLWSLMEFLNPGLLGSQAEFRRGFFLPIQVSRDAEATARLRRLTGPFVLRRVKTDPAVAPDLPSKLEMKVACTLTREQGSLYAAVLRDLEERLDDALGIARRGLILATLSKLKQVCNHPAHFLGDRSPLPGRSGKLERLGEMLEEVVASGDRALVFTQFAEMGRLLQPHLRQVLGREILFLHGGVPRQERERMVERFQAADPAGPPVFVLSLKAGGTGLNLTAASHVFHFDRWWNPAVEAQATDRAFRIGQRRNVQVHKFICAGTLEERIDALIEGKRALAENVVGTGEDWLTELSAAELREVLALRPEALEE